MMLTDEDSRGQRAPLHPVSPTENVFPRQASFEPCDTMPHMHKCHRMPCITTSCHLLLTFPACSLLPVDTVLVKCAFFMLWNTGPFWSFLLPLASRQQEMRVNWISAVSDRHITLRGRPSGAELAAGKQEKDKSQGLCSSDPLRWTDR